MQRDLYLLKGRRLPDREVERARQCFTKLIIARNIIKIDEAGFIRKCIGQSMYDREGDRCLPDTAWTEDRHQTAFFEKADYFRNHIVTTNRLGEKRWP